MHTCTIWCNMLSHICSSTGCHFKRFVDTYMKAWRTALPGAGFLAASFKLMTSLFDWDLNAAPAVTLFAFPSLVFCICKHRNYLHVLESGSLKIRIHESSELFVMYNIVLYSTYCVVQYLCYTVFVLYSICAVQFCVVQYLCCTVLWCTVLCCTILCCTILCCTVLWCTYLCCTVLCCTVLCCTVLCCRPTILVMYSIVMYNIGVAQYCVVQYWCCTVLCCTILVLHSIVLYNIGVVQYCVEQYLCCTVFVLYSIVLYSLKDARSLSLYPYTQILQYVKYAK